MSSTGWRSSTSSRSTRPWSRAKRWRSAAGLAGGGRKRKSRSAACGCWNPKSNQPAPGARRGPGLRITGMTWTGPLAGRPGDARHCAYNVHKEAPVEHAEDVLSRAPLFEALDDEGAKALRSLVTDLDLVRAERLFDEGDSGDRLYVVLEGKIKLTRAAPDGRENLLSVLGPGEMFGELSLFDPRPRTSSAVA